MAVFLKMVRGSSDSFAQALQTELTLNLPWYMFEKALDSHFK